jgi:hypothetical protein
MQLSGQIRSKKNWEQKMKDETIVAKWRKECSKHISEKQFNYVMQELKYYESLKENNIEVSAVDGVWQSDELIPQELKQRLIEGVAPLENVPDEEKDWHPGSDNQVLDLIHPSLYCFVHGRSRVLEEGQTVVPTLPSMGKGTPSKKKEVKKKWQKDYAESIDYQWLPAEFHVDTNGKVSIRSYINNLHPVKHRGLYRTIGDIFERFVPLFNKVLTDLLNPRPVRVEVDPYSWYDHLDKEEEEDEELEKKKEEAQNDKEKEEQKEVEDEQERENKRRKTEEGEGEEDNEEEQKEEGGQEEEEEEEDRHPKQPEPPEVFVAPPTPPLEKIVDLRGRNLQVIVKLANIILTPEKPSYPGGSWHVEGMINERIVSSGIYYYASENITESRLAFRQCVREPPYEQDDGVGVQEVFGLVNEEALNQPLGHVITQEDRCIAFPNMYQHQVAPFQLVDPKKPGLMNLMADLKKFQVIERSLCSSWWIQL